MRKKLSVFLQWLTAASLLFCLGVLGYQCLALYQGDAKPLFSAQKAAQALQQAFPVLICCLLFIALTLLLRAGQPAQSLSVPLSWENRLRLMKKYISALPTGAQQEEKRRRFASLLAAAGVLVCIIWCLTFLMNRDNFRSWEMDQVMENMLFHVVPALIVAGLILYITAVYCDRSRERECVLLRSISREMPSACPEKKNSSVSILRVVLLSAAILFIVLGAMNGGLKDMLSKAIKICTECIGLG